MSSCVASVNSNCVILRRRSSHGYLTMSLPTPLDLAPLLAAPLDLAPLLAALAEVEALDLALEALAVDSLAAQLVGAVLVEEKAQTHPLTFLTLADLCTLRQVQQQSIQSLLALEGGVELVTAFAALALAPRRPMVFAPAPR